MRILAIGGSGWLGARFVTAALSAGHDVTVVSRGLLPVPVSARHIAVDRDDESAWREKVMGGAEFTDGGEGPGKTAPYDYVVDFMGAGQKHGVQMLAIDAWGIPNVFVSSDLVYSPRQERYPSRENDSRYQTRFCGGRKYQMEWLFTSGSSRRYTNVVRPGYVYGPGRPLGPVPLHLDDSGLIGAIRDGTPLRLAGSRLLIQPLFIDDLIEVLMSLGSRPDIRGCKMNIAGPELIEAAMFYQLIGEVLELTVIIEDVSAKLLLRDQMEWEQHLRHRFLDTTVLLDAGLPPPRTGVRDGIRRSLKACGELP